MADRFDRFTQRARRVLTSAHEEAQNLEHNYVSPDEVMLGILSDVGGVADKVLVNLGLALVQTREDILRRMKEADELYKSPQVGQTETLKRLLEFAARRAAQGNDHYVSTEHLLVGFLEVGDGFAFEILTTKGITLEKVEAEIQKILRRDN